MARCVQSTCVWPWQSRGRRECCARSGCGLRRGSLEPARPCCIASHETEARGVVSRADAWQLVGIHGAGLVNAFFMRRGASLVEVRPYHFEGGWPDRYFRALSALEQAVHYFQVSAGNAALSIARPPDNVSVWGARDHAVWLPWDALRNILHTVIAIDGSTEHYVQQLWARGTRFVSWEAGR